jgi:hypothetical protein
MIRFIVGLILGGFAGAIGNHVDGPLTGILVGAVVSILFWMIAFGAAGAAVDIIGDIFD